MVDSMFNNLHCKQCGNNGTVLGRTHTMLGENRETSVEEHIFGRLEDLQCPPV